MLRLALVLCLGSSLIAQQPVSWSELAPLPDAIGFGGPACGTDGDALIVAGGANFPDAPPWEGGTKQWYSSVFVLPEPSGAWRTASPLTHPLAYAAVTSTPAGMAVLGGDDGQRCYAQAFLLRWSGNDAVRIPLPDLPHATTFASATSIGATIYLAAGQERFDDPTSLRRSFWRLDLDQPDSARSWEVLEPWPGTARQKSLLVAQVVGESAVSVFLLSGESVVAADDGAIVRTYHRGGFRFAVDDDSWHPVADAPTPVAAGTAVAHGQSHILVFSGSTGAHVTRPVAERPPFPTTVHAYHTITDSWTEAGTMPRGVVTTSAVRWRDLIVVPSGETRPGVRTNAVQAATPVSVDVGFGALNWAVLIAYLAMLVAMGFWFSRRENSTDDYFLAGKRIPWWAAGLSIYATQLSAITFISAPALAYATDWFVAPGKIAILLMAPLVIFCYLPFFRQLNVTTAYEYLERRFDLAVRLFGSASFVAFQLVRTAIVVYLPALALTTITGIDVYVCILMMGILATLYTVLGGMEAVIWTDVLQVFVLAGGMIAAFVIVVVGEGGFAAVFETAFADGKLSVFEGGWSTTELATWSMLLGTLLLQFGPYTTDQSVIQRYMTTKDEKAAARSIWLNGIISVPTGMLFMALGTALYVFFKSHPELLSVGMKNDEVFPLFVARQLPDGLSGLVIAGVFAASMSSLDSSMHSIATAVTTDFYRRLQPRASDRSCLRLARILTVAVGLFGTSVALLLATFDIGSLWFFFQSMLGLISSGLVGVFLLGVFTRRANARGVLTGAIASILTLYWVTRYTETHFYVYPIIGIGTAVLVGYGASLAMPGRSRTEGLTWHTRIRR